MGVQLLPLEALIKTGPVDHADWVYKSKVGWLQRLRFRLALELLPQHSGRLLEIGYGSGILMPELARRCEALFGVDPHPYPALVAEKLHAHGVTAELATSGAEAMPFPSGHFDAALAVSSLEFVADIDAACQEIRRVLAPGGKLVVITPGHSPLLDFGLRLLTGKSAREDYAQRRQQVIPTLRRHFTLQRLVRWPPVLSWLVPVYHALLLTAPAE